MRCGGRVALESYEEFVGRTTNWLYDYLTHVPRHRLIVLTQEIVNRTEFPQLEAWALDKHSFARRIWRRFAGRRMYPSDAKRLRAIKAGILHSHFGYTAVEDDEIHRIIETPWISSFYGADVYQLSRLPEWRSRYERLFSMCDRVLALGPKMKAELQKIGCPADKLTVQPIGVDCAMLPSASRVLPTNGVLKILFAGSFREKKGLQYLIEAVHLLNRQGVRFELDIVGDSSKKPGDEETKRMALQLISRFNLEALIRLHSWLEFRNLIRLALDSHVFVGPSVTAADGDAEGTPFVLQQMMATRMACIATRHSDIPFVYGDLSYLLVPERDSRAIADRLQAYVDSPHLLIEHGTALRQQVLTKFDIRQCATKLAAVYDTVSQ